VFLVTETSVIVAGLIGTRIIEKIEKLLLAGFFSIHSFVIAVVMEKTTI
jgi:hypothetical protein